MPAELIELNERLRGKGVSFLRIRRITGYMSTSTEFWGHAKQEEEKMRVKHITVA